MTRYRKVEVGTWNDRRFRELSPAPPNAQTLWVWLLTGPRTTIFPGLVIAAEAVIASDLRWPLDADLFSPPSPGPRSFREAWKEIADRGMAIADWEAGVVVLPKALIDTFGVARETARPTSPNVLRGWAKAWDDVPECDLRDEYLRSLGDFSIALDRLHAEADGKHRKPMKTAYLEAFKEAFASSLESLTPSFEERSHQPLRSAPPTAPSSLRGLTRARARGPVPVPVSVCVPDLAVPDLDRPSGASLPDLGGEPRVDRDQAPPPVRPNAEVQSAVAAFVTRATDRAGIRSKGMAVPPPPSDPASALRRSLVNSFVERVNAARTRLATELRLTGVRPIALMGEGERALMERLRESADPAADLDHVLRVAEAEARHAKELRWFGWSLAEPKAWRTRLAATLAEAKAGPREQRRTEPPSVPILEQFDERPIEVEMTDEDRAELRALNERLMKGDYTAPEDPE